VEGYYPADADSAYEEIKPWRVKRNHLNVADQMYTNNIFKKSKQYSSKEKFVVLSGAAHTNPYYEKDDPTTNTRLYGEFLSQGLRPGELRLIEVKTRIYPEVSARYNWSLGDYVVPLPKGKRPGCGDFESQSALDLVLFVDGI